MFSNFQILRKCVLTEAFFSHSQGDYSHRIWFHIPPSLPLEKHKKMEKQLLILLALVFSMFTISAQEHHGAPHQHNDLKHFRIAVIISHTSIPSSEQPERLFIPSWGLDLEYWINENWGIGSHNDIEVESFFVRLEGEEFIERRFPLVTTLEILAKHWGGLVLQAGPGLEFEKEKNYGLFRFGLEYEFEFGNHWDLAPTLFYDSRFNAFDTWSIGLGVGKMF